MKPFRVESVPAARGTVSVTFAGLPEAEYALSAFHGEDGDRRLARNSVGMPVEPFGFSRDASAAFGPPSYDETKVMLPAAGAKIAINLGR